MSQDPSFVILLQPPRDDFATSITEAEMKVIGEHFAYLTTLREQGRLVLAGRCQDASLGLAIITAASEEEARGIVEKDPAVAGKIFKAELRAFQIVIPVAG